MKAAYPYEGYNLYIVTSKRQNGRRMACLVRPGSRNEDRTTLSYARYLMSVELGRRLTREEEVDHIDGDKTNDDLTNLQILSPEANRRKQAMDKPTPHYVIRCPQCGRRFCRSRHRAWSYLTKGRQFCSRKCTTDSFKHPKLNGRAALS